MPQRSVEVDDFISNSASGLEIIKAIQSTASCFMAHLCRALIGQCHCVLVPKPLKTTLTAGIGEEGESLNFQVIAPRDQLSGLPTPKIYPLHLNNQLFHLADYSVILPLFSYAHRSYQVPSLENNGCQKESSIICLPPHLCRLFMNLSENKSSPTDEDLEKFTSGVFDGLICRKFPEAEGRSQGQSSLWEGDSLSGGSLLIH